MPCRGCLEKQLRIDELTSQVDCLRGKLRHQERSAQEGVFGSATPSSRKPFKINGSEENQLKKGGAVKGHKGHGRSPVSLDEADSSLEVKFPGQRCPDCGGALETVDYRERSVIDLPEVKPLRIRYRLQRCRCHACRKIFQAQPPGVLPKNLYGNQLLAEVAADHFLHGMPMGRIVARLGLPVGGLQEAMHQLARHFSGVMALLMQEYRSAPVKHADETGWRTDGQSGYAWIFCTPRVTLFLLRRTRSSAVPREVFGDVRRKGVLVVDRYGAYNRLRGRIQYCYAHLLRDVLDLEKEFPEDVEVVAFVNTIAPLLTEAMHLRGQKIGDAKYYRRARNIQAGINQAARRPAAHPGIQHIQNLFREHSDRMFHWVADRRVPAENNLAERQLRPTVIARKVSFGSQSVNGAKTREILMSILHTLKARGVDPKAQLKKTLDSIATGRVSDPVRELLSYNTS